MINKFKNSVSIIVPCYKISRKEVLVAVKKMVNYFDILGVEIEIIVSQNGSKQLYKIRNKNIKLVFTREKGLGIGIRNGLLAATSEYFYFLPPDIPFNFTDFTNMFPIRDKYDFIVGSKLCVGSIYKAGILRQTLSFIQRLVTKLFLKNFLIKDPNGTLFGNSAKARIILNEVKSNDFFFQTELLYSALKKKYLVAEVPVVYIKNDSKTTVNFFKDTIKYFSQLLKLSVRE